MIGVFSEPRFVDSRKGKAKCLRSRLLSYLRPRSRDPKAGRILENTRLLVWEPASSEFAALLRELELIRRWQPRLRTLFLMRRASLKYALQLAEFELPEAGRLALHQYNERSARRLDEMADRLEGGEQEPMPEPEESEQFVEQVLAACGCDARELPPQMRSFVILLRRIDGVTRWPATEIMIATDAVRALIRKGDDHQLRSQISVGNSEGMMTMEQSLADLVRLNRISRDTAFDHGFRTDDLQRYLLG